MQYISHRLFYLNIIISYNLLLYFLQYALLYKICLSHSSSPVHIFRCLIYQHGGIHDKHQVHSYECTMNLTSKVIRYNSHLLTARHSAFRYLHSLRVSFSRYFRSFLRKFRNDHNTQQRYLALLN